MEMGLTGKAGTKCPVHKDKIIKYFCAEPKCQKDCCALCLIKHQQHKVKRYDVEGALERKKDMETLARYDAAI